MVLGILALNINLLYVGENKLPFSVLCIWEIPPAQTSLLLYRGSNLKRRCTCLWGWTHKSKAPQSGKTSCFPLKVNSKPGDESQGFASNIILAMLWICAQCGNHLEFWDLGTVSRLTLASKFSSSLKQSILIESLPAADLLKPGRISLW